ncbi:AHH domain-containing protein [Acinetobacter sp. 11520]|nr:MULTISPECIES: AHH domain-containing protein [Acinetobacter]MDR0071429.1 AHH domain-containing protein [Acinetobacter sp. 11520]
MFKDAGVQEIVDVANNIKTLVSPTSTWFEKISAAVDLAVGIDIKAGKDVALAMKDKHIIQLKDPGPIHHICTNKNCLSTARGGPWTPQFQKYFDGAGLDINKSVENLVALADHKGPHPKEYHAYVEKELRLAVSGKQANTAEYRNAVIATLSRIKSEALVSGSQVNKWLTKK